jgi:CheY-like chemotaxis protein
MVKTTVLLADDDVDDREIFHSAIVDRKNIVLMPNAENGVEVIELLDAVLQDSELPDLIVLDQNMPRMNGKQTLEYLKATARYSHIPVIIYSTHNDNELVSDCSKLGASMVTLKPYTYGGYQEMVNNFLKVIN